MPYVLGIDVAQGRTHAATCRRQGPGWSEPEPLWLGERSPAAASALFLDDEGYLLTGDAAAQAGAQVPSRLLTGFHRRIGDDVPVLVEGEPFPPETLTTVLVEGIAEHAANLFGGPPQHLVLTHPGDWGGYRRDVLRRALAEAGFTAVTLVPGSVAALGAHLPVPGPGAQVAGVCEFGTDGVNVTLATASGAGGWQPGQTAEGVAPAAALSTLFALAGAASTSPKGLAGVVFCGDVPRTRCRPGRRARCSRDRFRRRPPRSVRPPSRRCAPRAAGRRRSRPPSKPPCCPRWTRSVSSASGRPGRRSRSRRSSCPSAPARSPSSGGGAPSPPRYWCSPRRSRPS
ncbi:molecular chaperone DnaK [Amycolatopsis sp. Hca4]|uniref:molecular chaperone DnaK n=1 Tax=Amycolatopsis sp. Hca4 TaxID=2742131 RepID=UPI0020CAAD20|nr:molecular chaperone DnaK [Amycolatopsis sp. Hca4]